MMEAEYVALSSCCRNLFPLIDITKELSSTFDLQLQVDANMHIKIHKDNVGALALGKLEPRQMTPGSKHYTIKYHWFWEHIGLRNIVLVKISSEDQLGDLFTKGLSGIKFYRLQKKLMGWLIHGCSFKGEYGRYWPIIAGILPGTLPTYSIFWYSTSSTLLGISSFWK
jgi:hypothetical protein